MPVMSIVRPGMLTTIQDLGRWGFQSRGVPVSGAMDPYSHRLANRLVGNDDNAATLEVTMIGPRVTFDEPATVAVTGAEFRLTVDELPVPMNTRADIRAGSVLRFGERHKGARAYVAVRGGLDVPQVLGSRSTHVQTRMGGLDGRALRSGDRVSCGSEWRNETDKATRPLRLPDGGAVLRVIPGATAEFGCLTGQRFRVSPESDRMGYRLQGPGDGGGRSGDLISHAQPHGAVQVPPAGQPILLMADHGTTGGYRVGAVVITADLPLAAQLAPGDWVEFEPCSLEDADRARLEQEAALGRA
jgi:antagonist of KipI